MVGHKVLSLSLLLKISKYFYTIPFFILYIDIINLRSLFFYIFFSICVRIIVSSLPLRTCEDHAISHLWETPSLVWKMSKNSLSNPIWQRKILYKIFVRASYQYTTYIRTFPLHFNRCPKAVYLCFEKQNCQAKEMLHFTPNGANAMRPFIRHYIVNHQYLNLYVWLHICILASNFLHLFSNLQKLVKYS